MAWNKDLERLFREARNKPLPTKKDIADVLAVAVEALAEKDAEKKGEDFDKS